MPNRLRYLSLVLILGAAACAVRVPARPPEPPTEGRGIPYRTARFESDLALGGSKPISMRVWLAPGSLREETTREGRTSIVLRNDRARFWWTVGDQEGFRTRMIGGQWRPSRTPDALEVARALPLNLDPRNCTFIGRERINGYGTLHYDYSWVDHAVRAKHEGSVWVLEDRLFPVRALSRGFDGNFEISNRSIVFDESPPNGIFDPPRDVKFRELKDFR